MIAIVESKTSATTRRTYGSSRTPRIASRRPTGAASARSSSLSPASRSARRRPRCAASAPAAMHPAAITTRFLVSVSETKTRAEAEPQMAPASAPAPTRPKSRLACVTVRAELVESQKWIVARVPNTPVHT
ncbi:MAG: hypothetical protein M5U28_33210 [Sandaracinaceae bacterium]|nr:hypothetical protein [Sandaracinaceae bacterium]